MPELPEVETVARGLQREVAGRRVVSVTLGKTDFMDNPGEIERALPGAVIRVVERYGKFMLLRLRGGSGSRHAEESALLVHLGMTGAMMPKAVSEARAKHTHLVALLDDGRELRYVDPRRFGRIAMLAGAALREELLRFGADPLEVKLEEFAARIQRAARASEGAAAGSAGACAELEIFTRMKACGRRRSIRHNLARGSGRKRWSCFTGRCREF